MESPAQIEKSALVQILREFLESEKAESERIGAGDAARELERNLTMLRFLPVRHYEDQSVIIASSLVSVSLNQRQSWVFLVPQGGGWILSYQGSPVQVVSPQSPMGEALLGKKAGDFFEVKTREGNVRRYEIKSVY